MGEISRKEQIQKESGGPIRVKKGKLSEGEDSESDQNSNDEEEDEGDT